MKISILLIILLSNLCLAKSPVTWVPKNLDSWNELYSITQQAKTQSYNEYTEIYFDADITLSEKTVITKIRRIIFYPNINSIQNNGADIITFNEALDTVKISVISTISPSGEEKKFSQHDLKINDANTYNTFSSQKNAVLSYTGLEPQSFVLVDYEIVRNLSNQESDWSRELFPQNIFPREAYRVTAHWQPEFPLVWNNTSKFVDCKDTKTSVSCEGKKISKIVPDDEIYWTDQIGSIQLGQQHNWDTIIQTALSKFERSQDKQEKISSFVKNLLGQEADIEKKISLIHNFVSQKIQYVSMSENGNSITPHSALRTLDKRLGDCKDKSALLFSMLKAINVKAYPVLVATERLKQERLKLPSLNFFDHMVICFDIQSKHYCIDATNSYSDWRYISPGIQGKVALPLLENASPINLPKSNYRLQMNSSTIYTFLPDGGQSEEQVRYYESEYASFFRNFFSNKDEKQIEDWLITDYHDHVASKADPILKITDLNSIDKKLTIRSETIFKPYIDTNVDLTYTENDSWILYQLDNQLIRNKAYEYNLSGAKITSLILFDITAKWNVKTLPASIFLENKYGSLSRNSKVNKGKIEVLTELKIPRNIVSLDEISKFNEYINLLKKESTISIYGTLKK